MNRRTAHCPARRPVAGRQAETGRTDPSDPAPPAAVRRHRDERGEALPAAILFGGVLFMVLVGIHVVILAMARTAVQSAADAAVVAAQAAGSGESECDDDAQTMETARECEGALAARIAMAASRNSIVETRPPAVDERPEQGIVRVIVFGGTISPVFGGIEVTAEACGPLDNVAASELASPESWQCPR